MGTKQPGNPANSKIIVTQIPDVTDEARNHRDPRTTKTRLTRVGNSVSDAWLAVGAKVVFYSLVGIIIAQVASVFWNGNNGNGNNGNGNIAKETAQDPSREDSHSTVSLKSHVKDSENSFDPAISDDFRKMLTDTGSEKDDSSQKSKTRPDRALITADNQTKKTKVR